MANAPQNPAPCPGRLGCRWSLHRWKHFPHAGLKREHTVHGPARYLPGTTAERIRAIESQTVGSPDATLSVPPGRAEYVAMRAR